MKSLRTVLRVVLILLVVVVAVEIGVKFAPRLAQLGASPRLMSAGGAGASQPDWGGGQLSYASRSPGGLIDSAKTASNAEPSQVKTFSGRRGGVMVQQKSGSDYALTMALGSPRHPGRTALFDVPSSEHFRKELLPREGDAEPPARDIPLYPQARCHMQVGRGSACFIGFYLTADSVEAVRSFYVRTLGRLGWERVPAANPGPIETFTKRNTDRAVVLQLRRQDSTTTRIGLVATTSGRPDYTERK
ncbi:hypothetical protein JXD38_02155 [candidate division WOR-3 bacterium]|nr:hypothetical protein [candidate division WOR-3 bacterium]